MIKEITGSDAIFTRELLRGATERTRVADVDMTLLARDHDIDTWSAMIDKVEKAVESKDEKALEEAYRDIIKTKPEDDFWYETFCDGNEFELRTLSKIKSITIHELCVIPEDKQWLFDELFSQDDIDMMGWRCATEDMDRDDPRYKAIAEVGEAMEKAGDMLEGRADMNVLK